MATEHRSHIASTTEEILNIYPNLSQGELQAYRAILLDPRNRGIDLRHLPALRRRQLQEDRDSQHQGHIDPGLLEAALADAAAEATAQGRAEAFRQVMLTAAGDATRARVHSISITASPKRAGRGLPPAVVWVLRRGVERTGHLLHADMTRLADALWTLDRATIDTGLEHGLIHAKPTPLLTIAADGVDLDEAIERRRARRRF
ncbi:MAG: hypothetical protein ACTH0V_00165 [Microbacteriaceae bacterium]